MKWLRKSLQLWLEFIIFAPIPIMIGILLFPKALMLYWFAVMLSSPLIGLVLRGILHLRRNWMLLPFALGWGWLAVEITVSWSNHQALASFNQWIIAIIVTSVLAILLFYRGAMLVSRAWEDLFPPQYQWSGLIVYFFSYFFFRYSETLAPYESWVLGLGLFSLGFILWNSNSIFLQEASQARWSNTSLPRSLVKMNKIFIIGLFGIIVLLGSIKQIKDTLHDWLRMLWNYLFSGEVQEEIVPEQQQPLPDFQLGIEDVPHETALFWRILELVFYWAVGIGIVVGLIWLIIIIMPQLRRAIIELFHKIIAFLRRNNNDEEAHTAYVDEASKLTGWNWRKALQNRLRKWRRREAKELKWSELIDQRAKVRYLYRQLVAQAVALGYSFRPQLTPAETFEDIKQWQKHMQHASSHDTRRTAKAKMNSKLIQQLNAQLSSLYNEARYSLNELPEELIQQWKKESEG